MVVPEVVVVGVMLRDADCDTVVVPEVVVEGVML